MAGRRSRKLLLAYAAPQLALLRHHMAWTPRPRIVASDGGGSGRAGWQRRVDDSWPALLQFSRPYGVDGHPYVGRERSRQRANWIYLPDNTTKCRPICPGRLLGPPRREGTRISRTKLNGTSQGVKLLDLSPIRSQTRWDAKANAVTSVLGIAGGT